MRPKESMWAYKKVSLFSDLLRMLPSYCSQFQKEVQAMCSISILSPIRYALNSSSFS